MIRGFYSATSGLIAQQNHMNIIANNLANTSTTAYKPQTADFETLLYANLNGGNGEEIQSGHGTRLQGAAIQFSQGTLLQSGVETDLAIIGEGFFALQDKENGGIRYTRDGSFQISQEKGTTYLVSSRGEYVLDDKQKKIDLKDGFDPAKLGVFIFPNKYGLTPVGGNAFVETEGSGKAVLLKGPEVKSGYLEGSAVEVGQEMVRMIEASKGFGFNAKLVQAADEMEKIINQLR